MLPAQIDQVRYVRVTVVVYGLTRCRPAVGQANSEVGGAGVDRPDLGEAAFGKRDDVAPSLVPGAFATDGRIKQRARHFGEHAGEDLGVRVDVDVARGAVGFVRVNHSGAGVEARDRVIDDLVGATRDVRVVVLTHDAVDRGVDEQLVPHRASLARAAP